MLNLTLCVIDVFKSALAQHCQGLLVSDHTSTGPVANNATIAHITQLCVAFSGGLDSSVLLDVASKVCKQANIPLIAVHINHGISIHANSWQAHCEHEATKRQVPFFSESIRLTKTVQKSLEADARDARYTILDRYALAVDVAKTAPNPTSKIKANSHTLDTEPQPPRALMLLGQHQNDQAETFLLQLKRGSGVQGLAAMPMLLNRKSGARYLRPFLKVGRVDLMRYASENNVQWIEDESNNDNRYDRNFLRNQIIPLMQTRWPSINSTIARSAHNCAQAHEVNTEYMQVLARTLSPDIGSVLITPLLAHCEATQRCFIRFWLDMHGLKSTAVQLDDIIYMVHTAPVIEPHTASAAFANTLPSKATNTSPFIQLQGCAIERFQGKLLVTQTGVKTLAASTVQAPILIDWQHGPVIRLNDKYELHLLEDSINYSLFAGGLSSKTPCFERQILNLPKKGVECLWGATNLRFNSHPKRPSKKLKSLYQEWQISPLRRQQTPVFVYRNTVLAVGLRPLKLALAMQVEEVAELSTFVQVELIERS